MSKENIFFIIFFISAIVGIYYGGYKMDEYKHRLKTITLQNGQSIQCHVVIENQCGGLFYECLNGQRYQCQTNYSIKEDE